MATFANSADSGDFELQTNLFEAAKSGKREFLFCLSPLEICYFHIFINFLFFFLF